MSLHVTCCSSHVLQWLLMQPQMIKGDKKKFKSKSDMSFITHYHFFIKNYCFDLICGKKTLASIGKISWGSLIFRIHDGCLTGERVIGLQRYLGNP